MSFTNQINTITKARILGLGDGIDFKFYIRPKIHKENNELKIVGTNIVVYRTKEKISQDLNEKPILGRPLMWKMGTKAEIRIPHSWKCIQIDICMFSYIDSSVTIKIKNINQLDFNHTMIDNMHKRFYEEIAIQDSIHC